MIYWHNKTGDGMFTIQTTGMIATSRFIFFSGSQIDLNHEEAHNKSVIDVYIHMLIGTLLLSLYRVKIL